MRIDSVFAAAVRDDNPCERLAVLNWRSSSIHPSGCDCGWIAPHGTKFTATVLSQGNQPPVSGMTLPGCGHLVHVCCCCCPSRCHRRHQVFIASVELCLSEHGFAVCMSVRHHRQATPPPAASVSTVSSRLCSRAKIMLAVLSFFSAFWVVIRVPVTN